MKNKYMMGDYVIYFSQIYEVVSSGPEHTSIYRKDKHEYNHTVPNSYIQPIPIRESDLIKLGFVDVRMGGFYALYLGLVTIIWNAETEKIKCREYVYPHIRYVHQLQQFVYANFQKEITYKKSK